MFFGKEISCNQWERPNMHSMYFIFPFKFGGRGGGRREDFFSFLPSSF